MLNAHEYERHAGCKTKHPNNHIYFENGKSTYQVVQELRSIPETQLYDAIQTATGSPINQKAFLTWKGGKSLVLNFDYAFVCRSFPSPPPPPPGFAFMKVECALSLSPSLHNSGRRCSLNFNPTQLSPCFPFPQNHFKLLLASFNVYMGRRTCIVNVN